MTYAHTTAELYANHNRLQERTCACGAKFTCRTPQGKYCDACREPARLRKKEAWKKRGAK